jgi:hypothetical protein
MALKERKVNKTLVVILVLSIVPIASGKITLQVREADGETPFDGNDIMVGSRLTLIVNSDSNDYWSGGLFIAGQDRTLGTLEGRDYEPNRPLYEPNSSFYGKTQFIRDWNGSHYEDAGELARVTTWKDSLIWGFDLYTSDVIDINFVVGDWFIIDYKAEEVGNCNVGFYDYGLSWNDPNYLLNFSHVPTRDLNFDDVVNFGDFALFALQLYSPGCNDPNWCDGADLDRDSDVDFKDLGLFVDYWLWGASVMEVGEESNSQQMMGDGMSEMQEYQQFQSVQEIDIDEQQIDVDDIIRWWEEVRVLGEEAGRVFDEAEWQDFIDRVRNAYQ